MSKVKEFFDEHGIAYKQATDSEITLALCPTCGSDKGKCYVNLEKGMYHCKNCEAAGSFFKLKSLFGIVDSVTTVNGIAGTKYTPLDYETYVHTPHKQLLMNSAALDYLSTRGFNSETIENFNLCYSVDNRGEWIGIPHMNDGECWNVKYRRFSGGDKEFHRVKGQPTVLFNLDGLDFKKSAICIVESETDCMAAWQMGVKNTVSLTAGASGFQAEWLETFAQFQKVYVVLNADDAGEKGAQKLARKIGMKKCLKVSLPTKDVNDYLTSPAFTSEDFKREFNKATFFEAENVTMLGNYVEELRKWLLGETEGLNGLTTGFTQLDAVLNGLKEQDMIIMSGDSGVGKTTFANNIIMHNLKQGNGVFTMWLEGQVPYYISRMIGAEMKVDFNEFAKNDKTLDQFVDYAKDLPLSIFTGRQGGLEMKDFKEIIEVVMHLYEPKLILIDNLQKMVRGVDQIHARIGEAAATVKDLAVDFHVPIILISHIRKTDAKQKVITMHDAKSSSTIYQDADIFLILQEIIEKGDEKLYLTVDKNRMGEGGVNIPLVPHREIGWFEEEGADVVTTEKLSELHVIK